MQRALSPVYPVRILEDFRQIPEAEKLNGKVGVYLGVFMMPGYEIPNPLLITEDGKYIWGGESHWHRMDLEIFPVGLVAKCLELHQANQIEKFRNYGLEDI